MQLQLTPDDVANQQLLARVHPSTWRNPAPARRYHLVVLGGGTAGLVAASLAAGLGARVALVERHLLGGDCLNYGCVPSKALLRAARAARQAHRAAEFGVAAAEVAVRFPDVMRRMRELRARISQHDSVQRFTDLGVDVFLGEARFVGPTAVEVEGRRLSFKRCILATGARPARLKIAGLGDTDYLTNESVFSLAELPARLLIVGTGPMGCELAQAFCRFGSEVHLIGRSGRLLAREEPSASEIVADRLRGEGVRLHLSARVLAAASAGGTRQLSVESAGQQQTLEGDALLLAVGRTPNVDTLNLAAGGIQWHAEGVVVDDFLRTTNHRVYAAGDVVGRYAFTHAADAMARMCIQNAFFFGRQRLSRLLVPHATYTDPEVAQVGLTQAAAAEQRIDVDAYRVELNRVDRALLDGAEEGFAEVLCRKGSDRILGATIVAAHAGELISQCGLMMSGRMGLSQLRSVIYPYPTQAEVLKRVGDQYQRQRLTPRVAWLLRTILRSRR